MKFWVVAATVSLLLFSCMKEIQGDAVKPSHALRCTGCDYLPVCDSMKLTYVDSSAAGVDTTKTTLAILGDTTVNGTKFTGISPFAGFTEGLLYHCNGGNYRIYEPVPDLGINIDSLLQDFVAQLGLPISINNVVIPSHIQTTILKTTVAAGTNWSDTVFTATLFPSFTINATLDYTLTEKNIQYRVFNKLYKDVMHVSSTLNITAPLLTIPVDLTIDYYFAKAVGLIENDVSSNGVLQVKSRLLE